MANREGFGMSKCKFCGEVIRWCATASGWVPRNAQSATDHRETCAASTKFHRHKTRDENHEVAVRAFLGQMRGKSRELDKARKAQEKAEKRASRRVPSGTMMASIKATDLSLPACDCASPPWEDCIHTSGSPLDREYREIMNV
jgi:hypothetical protein